MTDTSQGWKFWIDRGGTFTDVVAVNPQGRLQIRKLLSKNPEHYSDAPLQAIRSLMAIRDDQTIPGDAIEVVKMGTTLATNALLEREGAKVALLITKGFRDLLEIGYQDRPDIFALDIRKPQSLASKVIEVDERVLDDGHVRIALNDAAVSASLRTLRNDGFQALAVVFLHSFAFPAHEQRVGELAQAAGFQQISLSHCVAREINAVGRGDTTLADAYLSPILRDYVSSLRDELGAGVALRFMQSSGGLTDAQGFSGKNAILSGPAAGVVAAAHVARLAGFDKIIGFDMGGTSTDVSRFDGQFERVYERTIAGVRIKAPMMAIETVAAGGGSKLNFEGRRFTVGPASAGADPGPACYRRGGPATVTDANVVLGRIQPEYFPACFGKSGHEPLHRDAARARLQALADQAGETRSVESLAAGFICIANENMVRPIKDISIAQGYDVQEYALVCFGGAGAQHACAIAEKLGIRAVLLHPLAGVLSAYGMGLADSIQGQVRAVLEVMTQEVIESLGQTYEELEDSGSETLHAQGFDDSNIVHVRSADLRYAGADAYINVRAPEDGDLAETFEARHMSRYGFIKAGSPIEIVNIRVESIGRTLKPHAEEIDETTDPLPDAIDCVSVHFDTPERGFAPVETPVYRREQLRPGHVLRGPALIVEEVSTIVVDPGWGLSVDPLGNVLLRLEAKPRGENISTQCEPVMLEVFNNLFMSVAEQMGETLQRVSHSANIKERLDFSCALFNESGELVANAPHIPVHLGAMSESVKAVLRSRGDSISPGEVYMTNNPYNGGSHLPDITVITPVFIPDGQRAFFVANRGHHADIGGISPGSMPPFSKTIYDEGIVLDDVLLVSHGQLREAEVLRLLSGGDYPARNIPERFSDLHAQIAANVTGINRLKELCSHYGPTVVQAYMSHVRRNAAEAMADTIERLPDGVHYAEDFMDNGAKIACTITVAGRQARVDFSGTSAQLDGNLNAPPAVVVAAVLYAFRTLIGKPIPLNGGCLDPITIDIPQGSLLRPVHPAAVVGGNVETSNRVVDVIYQALEVVAASQGTMNNLTFGTDTWAYYETICGGAGAGRNFHGASAVHTHMTNTRITDPEVLERRYPVIVNKFAIRENSGGAGRYRGGDGVIRAIEFREPVSVGILSERRTTRPPGLGNGEPGSAGRNLLLKGGKLSELEGHAALNVDAGDSIIIETPGGGGFREPKG